MHSGNEISEYVARLGLSRAIQQYENWFEFLSKRIFVSEYFGAQCCRKISEPDWSRSQLKKYRSGAGA